MTVRASLSAAAAILASASLCAAQTQTKLIITSAAEDIDSTGNKSLGRLVEWSAGPTASYVPYIFERGVGYTRIPGVSSTPTLTRGSSDFSAILADLPNSGNWGNLNCFAGYCFGSMTDCTPGTPLPPPSPCLIPNLAHRWTQSTGWVSTGSLARVLDPGTGRYYGGTRCDQTINAPYDISGNGRYIVGGAWSAPLTTSSGGPGFGQCGDYHAFIYDAQTASFTALTSASGSKTTRADRVSNDGGVITGYDLGDVSDGEGGFYEGRRMCVWTNGVQSLLDTLGDGTSIFPVNGPGTTIAGAPTAQFNLATFGSGGIKLVKWVRQPNDSWVPQNLGRPVSRDHGLSIDILVALYPQAVSDDGNTIVGTALYNSLGPGGLARLFIWKPTLNGGVPIDLLDYIQATDPANPLLADGYLIESARSISADGNAIAVDVHDKRNTCTNGATSLETFSAGILYLNGASIGCEPARIAVGPSDWTELQWTPYGIALNVAASGSWPLNYQWQRETSPGTWTDLDDECGDFDREFEWGFEGTRTAQLRVGQQNCGGDRAGRYRVVVSNSCGSVTSNPATVAFSTTIDIVLQPSDAVACISSASHYSVGNLGSGPATYVWQISDPFVPGGYTDLYDDENYAFDGRLLTVSGSDTRNLEVIPDALGSTGSLYSFRCVITSPCASATSDAATLTICPSDHDCNGFVNGDDFDAFIVVFELGEAAADFDRNGFVNGDDFDGFVVAFEAGC